jgi:uncharacterized protein DUF3768
VFDDFCHANDSHEEHDFGSFEADGHMIMFKIDYYDQNLSMHSPDPTDPSVTQRVITIMLAEEYWSGNFVVEPAQPVWRSGVRQKARG